MREYDKEYNKAWDMLNYLMEVYGTSQTKEQIVQARKDLESIESTMRRLVNELDDYADNYGSIDAWTEECEDEEEEE